MHINFQVLFLKIIWNNQKYFTLSKIKEKGKNIYKSNKQGWENSNKRDRFYKTDKRHKVHKDI